MIDAECHASVYTCRHTNAKPTLSRKKNTQKNKLGAPVKNFVCTFATDTHIHNTTHTSIQAVCKVKGSTQPDDNVVFLLQGFYGRCASAVKAEGMHWGLVN